MTKEEILEQMATIRTGGAALSELGPGPRVSGKVGRGTDFLDKMDNRLPSDGNPSFEFDQVEGEVNMNGSNMAEVLSEQKAQDIKDIERL